MLLHIGLRAAIQLEQRLCGGALTAITAAPGKAVPPKGGHVIKVAAVVRSWRAAVCRPPAPLQRTLVAAQSCWDPEVHGVQLVVAFRRREVPALWVSRVDGLAVPTLVVCLAVAVTFPWWHAFKLPLVQAGLRVCN